jgi:molybdate transport system substrate-binding protein
LTLLLVATVLAAAVVVAPGRARLATQLNPDVTITVSAASDLTPAFHAIGARFEEETGVGVDFNFGSTGQLTQQIVAGAPVDVFAAANVTYIEQLAGEDLIIPDTQVVYGQGRIVLWTAPVTDLSVTSLEQLIDPEIERIAIANPDHAPYGVAAREALESAGIWDEVQDRLVFGENVTDTLRLAQTGNVDVAIVALSLALDSDGEWTLVDGDLHAPIDQALAVIAGTPREAEARAFADFVMSDEGREIMRRYGFVLPGEPLELGTPAATPAA